MIILSNGDKWIIDDSEWVDADIDYMEACKGNIPRTNVRDFVKKLCDDDSHDIPRKLTHEFPEGYWDADFDPYKEVLGSIAVASILNPWSEVYCMPWGEVIVVYRKADGGGYDVMTATEVYKCPEDYFAAVILPKEE